MAGLVVREHPTEIPPAAIADRPRPAASSPWGARRGMTAPWWSR